MQYGIMYEPLRWTEHCLSLVDHFLVRVHRVRNRTEMCEQAANEWPSLYISTTHAWYKTLLTLLSCRLMIDNSCPHNHPVTASWSSFRQNVRNYNCSFGWLWVAEQVRSRQPSRDIHTQTDQHTLAHRRHTLSHWQMCTLQRVLTCDNSFAGS